MMTVRNTAYHSICKKKSHLKGLKLGAKKNAKLQAVANALVTNNSVSTPKCQQYFRKNITTMAS